MGVPEPSTTMAEGSGATGASLPARASTDQNITTDKAQIANDKIEAFLVVKAILREVVEPRRVFMRDAESYCAVLLDDNNRRTICRLRFGTTRNVLGLLNPDKSEDRVTLSDMNDLYLHAERLKAAVSAHVKLG